MGSRRILIVDDNASVRETLSDLFRVRGYDPQTAATGKAAVEAIEKEAPAVALIDLKLKDRSGVELVRRIREISPGTECIILTGYASQASAIEAINLGAHAYLEKTCDVEQLLATVGSAIAKGETVRAAQEGDNRYEELFDNSLDAIAFNELVTDGEGKAVDFIILEANHAFGKLAGLDPDEIIGQRATEALPDIVSGSTLEMCGQVVSTGEPARFEEYVAAFGAHFHITVFPIDKGRFGTIFTDISELIRAQQSLQHRGGSVEDLEDYAKDLEQLVEERLNQIRRLREELARSRRMAALGQVAKEGIDELRRPLAKLSNAIYFLKRSLAEADETTKDSLDAISLEIRATERIVSRLLNVLRPQSR